MKLEAKGAKSNKNCCVLGVVHGRGLMGSESEPMPPRQFSKGLRQSDKGEGTLVARGGDRVGQ